MTDSWIHNFTITETSTHKKNYTIYKIVSIVFPRQIPEALSTLSVWKRYSEAKKLYRDVSTRQRQLHLKGKLPDLKPHNYFKRFDDEVIEERKQFILDLLYFIAQYPALYKSEVFNKFFNGGHSPSISPKHTGNIAAICAELDIDIQPEIILIDPTRDNDDSIQTESFVSSDSILIPKTNGTTDVLVNHDIPDASLSSVPYNVEESVSQSLEDDLCDYIYEAALEFSNALQAEVNGNFKEAFNKYKNGIDKLLNGAKNDLNIDRQKIAKDKTEKYLTKAEYIYQNFICGKEENLNTISSQLENNNVNDTFRILYLERPINHLSKFKVLKIIDNVMQVQDITNKKIFIMKVIQNYAASSEQKISLINSIPYMVSIVSYFQSETSTYVLLKQASGGKLWDYIKSHRKINIPEKSVIQDLFRKHETQVKEEEHNKSLVVQLATTSNATENSSPEVNSLASSGYDSGFVDLVNDYKNPITLNAIDNKSEENLTIDKNHSPAATDENDTILLENHIQNYIPPFDILSQDMDVNDLVNCSQNLIKSVSLTLEQSSKLEELKKIETKKNELILLSDQVIVPKIPKITIDDHKSKKEFSVKMSANNSVEEKINDLEIFSSICLPEGSIRQWAREFIVAIDELHKNEIICGDLRMDNLLLGSNGRLQLTLFYRRFEKDLEFDINPDAGDKMYVAPERPLTASSDLWSFGVILFELLTLKTFESCHPGGIINYYRIQYPETEISEDAKHLLEGILQINPNDRFNIEQIKSHPFFMETDWDEIIKIGYDENCI